MNTIWILLVITHVHYGVVTSFQEFNSLEACTQAQGILYQHAGGILGTGAGAPQPLYAICVPKGELKK